MINAVDIIDGYVGAADWRVKEFVDSELKEKVGNLFNSVIWRE
jgi:hypothetical protein